MGLFHLCLRVWTTYMHTVVTMCVSIFGDAGCQSTNGALVFSRIFRVFSLQVGQLVWAATIPSPPTLDNVQ